MSSHHFVKEDQEPALILACQFDIAAISPFLEWSPLIITLPDAIDSVLLSGVKTDIILVGAQEVERRTAQFEHQMPVKVLTAPPHGNHVATALEFLSSTARLQVNIWCCDALTLMPVAEESAERLEITLADPQSRWSAIRSGRYAKWYPQGTTLKVKSRSKFEILSANLQSDGNELRVTADGIVRVQSANIFWLGEMS